MQMEMQLAQWKAEQEIRLKYMELGAEAELERLEIEIKGEQNAGTGNIPSPVN